MKKVVLYYFSGTGNTALCAESLGKHFKELGYEVTLYEYQKPFVDVPNPNDFDLVGIGYPIHAFNVCGPFVKFVKALPSVKEGKNLFFFKVSGEPFAPNNASSYHIYLKLKKKGFNLVGEKHFLMPYNIMFRYKDPLAKQMYLYLDPLCEAFAKSLDQEKAPKIPYRLGPILVSFFLRIEWLAPKVNCLLAHSKKKKCTKCYKCVKSCPTQSMVIKKNGGIRIASSCAVCMRCTMNCPVDAIDFGLLNLWRINKPYPYAKLVKDENVPGDYVNYHTKGYFKHFRKFYLKQNDFLKEYGIALPVSYPEEDKLEKLRK